MSAPTPQWFVLGAGSIGCLYAAYLQRAGVATTLLLRDQARLQQFHDVGLTLQLDDVHWPVPIAAATIASPTLTSSIVASPTMADHRVQPIARLLLCTKAHHSSAAIAAVRAQLADDVTIVLLQNGMGVREELQALLPRATLVHALSTEGAWQPQRFHVVHAGHGETLVGPALVEGTGGSVNNVPINNAINHAINNAMNAGIKFAGDLSHCGLRARVVDDIEPQLWHKLAVNCVINPLTAVRRCRNGELLNVPDIAAQIDSICAEIAAVAGAIGVVLAPATLAAHVREVMQRTAANRSSMLQDIEAGRATEIGYLNGYVVQLAARHGIAAPANAALQAAVEKQTAGAL